MLHSPIHVGVAQSHSYLAAGGSVLRIRHWHPVNSGSTPAGRAKSAAPADVPLGIGISVCSRSSILKRQTPDPRSLARRPGRQSTEVIGRVRPFPAVVVGSFAMMRDGDDRA